MSDPGRVFEVVIKKWRQLAIESWHHTVMTAYQTCVADLEAALQGSASPPTEGWQDISTAPKRTSVLLYVPDEEGTNWSRQIGYLNDDDPDATFWNYRDRSLKYVYAHPPTHWQPLPSPPRTTDAPAETP